MGKIFLTLFMFVTIINTSAQTENHEDCKKMFHIGGELDLFPYITGGYYGSVFGSYDHIKLRLVYSQANVPKFILPEGFDKNKIKVYALLFDYFLNDEAATNSWWLGAGFELWKNKARNENDKTEGSFENYIFTAGGGYVYYITENIYLNPWAAFHLRIAGDKETGIGNAVYKSPLILPEVSLKIGFVF